MDCDSLSKMMKQKAEAVQAVVSMVKSFEDCCRYAAEMTRKQDGKTLISPGLENETLITLKAACDASGIQLLPMSARESIRSIHTALTFADWGIAETGTLVLKSTSENLRIATMLSEVHIAILPVSNIYGDAMALEDKMLEFQKSGPGYLAFITGPSRTADIERVLTIGVHGPKELHILIMEDK